MPTLMIRQISAELMARLRTYAHRPDIALSTSAAAAQLLTIALDHLAARAAGAAAINDRLTPQERSASARHAVQVREAKRAAKPHP